jgi:hypothetical protein
MQKSETIGELAKALATAQGKIKGAAKDSENPFFKSKYADLAAVWDACRGPLSENGLAVIQTTLPTEEDGTIPVETMLAHSSGEWISGTLKVLPKQSDPQSMGSAITYARRYALAAAVGVAPEDDDGNAASQGSAPPRAPKTTGKPAAAPKLNAAETVEIKKSIVDVCRLLNEAGDVPPWTAKRADEFSVQEYGSKIDDLEIEPLRELLKKLTLKYDALKQAKPQEDPAETERQRLIAKIFEENKPTEIAASLKRCKLPETTDVNTLSLDQLVALNEDLDIPF